MAFSRSVGEGDISVSVAQVVDRYVTSSWQPAARRQPLAARRPGSCPSVTGRASTNRTGGREAVVSAPMPFTSEQLLEIRDRFHHADVCPIQGPRAFFENAGGSLTLKAAVERTAELMAFPDNQGRANAASQYLMEIIAQGRDDMKLLMGASSGEVFIGESGTELLGRLIRNATLASSGAKILGSHLEHPATYSAGRRWAEVAGMTYEQVDFDTASTVVSVEQYRPALTPDLAVATIIHASPVTGMHVDVKAIAAEIRAIAPECFIIVDGIQHAAHGHVAVDDYGIDGYVVSATSCSRDTTSVSHGSPTASQRHRTINSPVHPPTSGNSARDASAYAAFSEVVRYLEWLGAEVSDETEPRAQLEAASAAIRDQEQDLVDAMMWGTGGLPGLGQLDGVHVVGPEASEHRSGMVSFGSRATTASTSSTPSTPRACAPMLEAGLLLGERARTARHSELHSCVGQSLQHPSRGRAVARHRQSAGRVVTRGSPRQPHPPVPPPMPVVTPHRRVAPTAAVGHRPRPHRRACVRDARTRRYGRCPDRYAELLIAAGGRRRNDGRVLLPRPMVEAALTARRRRSSCPASSTTTVCRSEEGCAHRHRRCCRADTRCRHRHLPRFGAR